MTQSEKPLATSASVVCCQLTPTKRKKKENAKQKDELLDVSKVTR
jgi:hypothetical protein